MDGNGRWAKKKVLNRIRGHEEAVKSVREIIEECSRLGIEQLTLYSFSTENWKRPRSEVEALMRLLSRYLVEERKTIRKNNVRFTAIGQIEALPKNVQKELEITRQESKNNTGLVVCLALSYGGRDEIVRASRLLAEDVARGRLKPEEITEDLFASRLYTRGMSDPDLLIRTAGELRISNFLLWQISYAEIWVTPVLWPDFRKEHLYEALEAYAKRERRFGGVTGLS
jgi:undecaprenyl diphosphate synthase